MGARRRARRGHERSGRSPPPPRRPCGELQSGTDTAPITGGARTTGERHVHPGLRGARQRCRGKSSAPLTADHLDPGRPTTRVATVRVHGSQRRGARRDRGRRRAGRRHDRFGPSRSLGASRTGAGVPRGSSVHGGMAAKANPRPARSKRDDGGRRRGSRRYDGVRPMTLGNASAMTPIPGAGRSAAGGVLPAARNGDGAPLFKKGRRPRAEERRRTTDQDLRRAINPRPVSAERKSGRAAGTGT